jgi:tetratricopeptide (TPR) repeat protein
VSTVITYLAALGLIAFAIWGLVAAIRFRNWIWIPIQLVLPIFGAFLYFFFHIHRHAESGFELPGAVDKKRIARVQEDLARLDKAHLHAQLGDIYYAMGKLPAALASYEAAYTRDPKDLDIRAHYGATLARASSPRSRAMTTGTRSWRWPRRRPPSVRPTPRSPPGNT